MFLLGLAVRDFESIRRLTAIIPVDVLYLK